MRPVPALAVTTTVLPDPGSLIGFLPREGQLLWSRRGDGFVGVGTALRLEFNGATRFTDAAAAWRAVAERASVETFVLASAAQSTTSTAGRARRATANGALTMV